MELERLDILTRLLLDVPRAADVSIKSIATQTAAMVASDLMNLVNLAQTASLKRVMSSLYAPETHCRVYLFNYECVSAVISQSPNKILPRLA